MPHLARPSRPPKVPYKKKIDPQKIYQDKRWVELRAWFRLHEPLCRKCANEGRSSFATQLHHLVPFSRANSIENAEQLAYDPQNVCPLCSDCHSMLHVQLKENTEAYYKLITGLTI